MREKDYINEILLEASRRGWLVWRHNVGTAKDGKRFVRFGIAGQSDILGLRPVLITPEMVGGTIGQFVSLEVKTGNVPLTQKQRNWLDAVANKGGHAREVRFDDRGNNTGF